MYLASYKKIRQYKNKKDLSNSRLFTPHPSHFTSKKSCFTLAEGLITIGIIGVVAAITLPALIQKHNTIFVETKLEKFYSTINQVIKLSELKNGDKKYWAPKDTEDFWKTYLEPYIKYLKYENKRVGTSNDWRLVYLPDGSAFIFDI